MILLQIGQLIPSLVPQQDKIEGVDSEHEAEWSLAPLCAGNVGFVEFVAWSRCMLLRFIFHLIHGRLEENPIFRFSLGFVIEELMGSWVDMQGHGLGH